MLGALAIYLLLGTPVQTGERLGRGAVAVTSAGGTWISWRSLAGDAPGLTFDVYRSRPKGGPVRLNKVPLLGPTNFWDSEPNVEGTRYSIRTTSGRPANAVQSSKPYLSIPLRPLPGYTANDGSVGDLDGDGEYEVVVHRTGRSKDNSQSGETDPPVLEAYRLDGKFLWRIDLGRNVREGAHYTQFLVYDFDGDGRAEVACRTADGTVDGRGNVLGNPTADHRNENGYILKGPETLTVFEGRSGAALATVPYVPARHPATPNPTPDELKAEWGDGYGNRVDRFLACVAYLDGKSPSLVFSRGYYTRTVLAAWDFRKGRLRPRWVFDSAKGNEKYAGQGNHSLAVADVDEDGRDEILFGSCTIDDDGTGRYSTGLGHGDAMHVSDLDPDRPGLETFAIHEHSATRTGVTFRDARTGQILWRKESPDVGRGLSLDIDPRHPGAESWAAIGEGVSEIWNAKGEVISRKRPASCNFGVWWDGDPLREILDGTKITKWDWLAESESDLLSAEGCASNNGTKATPVLSADILGDWREEVIWRSADDRELRIYTSTIPTRHRQTTLMSDRAYRLSVAWQNVGYNQPPHPSFDMATRLRPGYGR